MELNFVSYVTITVLCIGVGLIFKALPQVNDKWIPVALFFTGLILGVVAFLIGVPDFPANDILNAMAVGAWSGLGAVGLHQVYKQFTKES